VHHSFDDVFSRARRRIGAIAASLFAIVAMLSPAAPGYAASGTAPASASAPNPVVTGPVAATAPPGDPSHDYPFFASHLDLRRHGYVEEEYFIAGTASRYRTPPGQTASVIDSGHPYKTRIVVRRPASTTRFNGTIVVEWINVTNGLDMENTWFQIDEHLLRSGYAWVGVSAQRVGVNRLRTWNPDRYGTLDVSRRDGSGVETITDDALSYDIMSQAAHAVRAPDGVDPLGGLRHRNVVIATGHSQSASRLSTYVNSIQPLAHAFDAFALHGSLGNAIRADLEVPVWKVLSEFDVEALEGRVRRPDEGLFRTWEVTGTSHNDRKSFASRVLLQRRDIGTAVEDTLDCTVMPVGSAVPFHYVMAAGLDGLVRWVRHGAPLPSAPPLEFASGPPGALARDEFGIARGGVRLSQVEVPIALSTGTNSGPGACDRWGFTLPFDDATLATLYRSHGSYVSRVTHVTMQNQRAGFIVAADARRTIREAADSTIGTP
jgi:hypothetical protein